jgi:hypothetical protein
VFQTEFECSFQTLSAVATTAFAASRVRLAEESQREFRGSETFNKRGPRDRKSPSVRETPGELPRLNAAEAEEGRRLLSSSPGVRKMTMD